MNISNKIPLTVVVPVKNEEKNLPRCLELLGDFDEVIVIDSNSTDRTPQIVAEFNYQLVNFNWNGQFPKKRNWLLRNVTLRNEWVLFLDADEFVTDAFKDEVRERIQDANYNGYWLAYNNHFLGKSMKHGIKFKKLPLFRVGTGEYEFIDEKAWSHLDMEVHEHPIIEGQIGEIKSPVTHLDFKNLAHYIGKHNDYSSWEANRYLKLKEDKETWSKLTWKQKIKYSLLNTWGFGFLYFLINYFLYAGFLDGKIGYVFSVYKMQYFFNIKAKIYELTQNKH